MQNNNPNHTNESLKIVKDAITVYRQNRTDTNFLTQFYKLYRTIWPAYFQLDLIKGIGPLKRNLFFRAVETRYDDDIYRCEEAVEENIDRFLFPELHNEYDGDKRDALIDLCNSIDCFCYHVNFIRPPLDDDV